MKCSFEIKLIILQILCKDRKYFIYIYYVFKNILQDVNVCELQLKLENLTLKSYRINYKYHILIKYSHKNNWYL